MVKYRILERRTNGDWAPFGVAYERDERLVLFAPPWRADRTLTAASLEELDERHCPSAEFRWRAVETAAEPVQHPIDLLQRALDLPPVVKSVPHQLTSQEFKQDPPLCILVCHIQAPQSECGSLETDVEKYASYRKIREYQEYLSSALEEQRTLLLLFYDAGWVDFMNVLGLDFNLESFANGIHAASRMSEKFRSRDNTTSWVRVVTTKELSPFVNNLRGDQPGEEALLWRRFFVSDQKRMNYDCSKVVEAIVRLRHIGSGIPVLRIDKDVLDALTEQEKQKQQSGDAGGCFHPSGPDGVTGAQWLARMLDRAKRNHRHCIESSDVYSFVFSGGYRDEGEEETPEPKGFTEWATAYSARVYPALFATKTLLEHRIQGESLSEFVEKVEGSGAFDDQVAQEFYGLDSEEPKGIIKFGAHPRKAVTSGSLFCLSDGAILDLPPFSNLQSNVIWIDDHLRYALHKGLGQIGQKLIKVPSLDKQGEERTLTARIPHCYLPKGRQTVSNFGSYVLGIYIPSLLRGMIMDRWICSKAEEKLSASPSKEPGVWTSALRAALARGRFEERERDQLRQRLRELALERIEEVRKEWYRLGWRNSGGKEEERETFASVWVKGKVREYARRIGANPPWANESENWLGWGLVRTPEPKTQELPLQGAQDSEPVTYDKLAPAVREDLDSLIEDAITYIDWARQWPQFVQAVRVSEPKAIALDLREDWG